MKLKTKKTVSKRFHITATGKVLHRYGGQDHFNARDSGKISRKKRRDKTMSSAYTRNIKTLIGNL
ncbi:MAG TPA: 50S ribosomal protein L35 [Candidatus Methylomirabilis sp.]|nr:50S ribosomal protein L35 [Candidatus Methylomirabilis sp.]